jgi:hypothetical protein
MAAGSISDGYADMPERVVAMPEEPNRADYRVGRFFIWWSSHLLPPTPDYPFPGCAVISRSGRKAARSSSENSCGSSQAAKWPPLSAS